MFFMTSRRDEETEIAQQVENVLGQLHLKDVHLDWLSVRDGFEPRGLLVELCTGSDRGGGFTVG